MHTMVGVNSYVFDDGKSMKSGFKFIWPSGVPVFASFGATAEPEINDQNQN